MTRRSTALDQAIADLTALRDNFAAAEARMMDARPALPGAASYDGSRGGGGQSSVEALALNDDPTARDRRQMDEALRQIGHHAPVLRRLVASWTPRPASAKDRASVERANDPTCEHCTQWVKPGNVELVHRTGDVAGNLETSVALGRWCYDFVRANGRLPQRGEVERHDAGLRVMVQA